MVLRFGLGSDSGAGTLAPLLEGFAPHPSGNLRKARHLYRHTVAVRLSSLSRYAAANPSHRGGRIDGRRLKPSPPASTGLNPLMTERMYRHPLDSGKKYAHGLP